LVDELPDEDNQVGAASFAAPAIYMTYGSLKDLGVGALYGAGVMVVRAVLVGLLGDRPPGTAPTIR
jgi:hypothetical protein